MASDAVLLHQSPKSQVYRYETPCLAKLLFLRLCVVGQETQLHNGVRQVQEDPRLHSQVQKKIIDSDSTVIKQSTEFLKAFHSKHLSGDTCHSEHTGCSCLQ